MTEHSVKEIKAAGIVLGRNRIAAGISQEFVAQESGISLEMISYIEKGETAASLQTLRKIAVVLNLDIFDVIKNAGEVEKIPKS